MRALWQAIADRRLAAIYMAFSALCFILGVIFGGESLSWAEHPTPAMWLGHLFGPLSVPAAYGVIAGFALTVRARGVGGTLGWTIPSFLISGLTLFVARALLMLGHIDCADNCVPSVEPYSVIDSVGWWLIFAALMPPLFAMVGGVVEARRRTPAE